MSVTAGSSGDTLSYTNATGSEITAFTVVTAMLTGCGVALETFANGAIGSVAVAGTFKLPKASGTAWVAGTRLYYDGTDCHPTPVLGDFFIGEAASSAGSTDTEGWVKLLPFSAEPCREITANAAAATTLVRADVTSGFVHVLVPNTTTVTVTVPAISVCPLGTEISFRKSAADAAAITYAGNASDNSGTLLGTVGTHDALNDTLVLQRSGTAFAVKNTIIA